MTRDEARDSLIEAGLAGDQDFSLLDAAVCCALHDHPRRDPAPVRALADEASQRLFARLGEDRPEDIVAEVMAFDLRLNGDLLTHDDSANTDIIAVSERRRGLSGALSIFYLHAADQVGLTIRPVDFPNHALLRIETDEGPIAMDPFAQGRVVMPSELRERALRAGLTPHVADRLDVLMAPISPRQALIRLQSLQFSRAVSAEDYPAAERSAMRRAWLEPDNHRPWLDVASAREKQGALTGALEALAQARQVSGEDWVVQPRHMDRLRMRLN